MVRLPSCKSRISYVKASLIAAINQYQATARQVEPFPNPTKYRSLALRNVLVSADQREQQNELRILHRLLWDGECELRAVATNMDLKQEDRARLKLILNISTNLARGRLQAYTSVPAQETEAHLYQSVLKSCNTFIPAQ